MGSVMRGADETSGPLFSYADPDARILARHPLRKIRQVVTSGLPENQLIDAGIVTF